MKLRTRAEFFHELSKLLAAGLAVPRALEVLGKHWTRGALVRWVRVFSGKLSEGASVADAFAADGHGTAVEVDLVRAGERGGRLAAVFAQLAGYYERLAVAEDRLMRACLYPVVLAHLVIFLDALPKMFVRVDWELGVSLGVKLLGLWACLIGLGLGLRGVQRVGSSSVVVDGFLVRVPWLGTARRASAYARFASVCETGLLAGLLLTETLELAAAASGSALVAQAARKAGSEIGAGSTLAEALERSGGFPPTVLACLSTAEVAGGLDTEMRRLATLQWQVAERAIQSAEEWVPRLAYWAVLLWMVLRIFGQFGAYTKYLSTFSSGWE
jgi:type II secretory pathway component PulF